MSSVLAGPGFRSECVCVCVSAFLIAGPRFGAGAARLLVGCVGQFADPHAICVAGTGRARLLV